MALLVYNSSNLSQHVFLGAFIGKRLQISRMKNIGSVFELSGVAFCLAPLHGGLLVQILQSLYILFWWMALFIFGLIEAILCAT